MRIALLGLLLALIGPIHIATKALAGRSPWPRRFLAAAAWIIGARIKLDGVRPGAHTLLVSNHLSWLDIVVLGGGTGTAFVSKDNLGHGLFHWLADQNGTVYVRREHARGAKDQAVTIARALERDQPVTLFPEGTTGPGTHLLPFRSTLLEAASFAQKDVQVRPVVLDYGTAAPEVGWYNEPGKQNILRILGRKGTLPVTIHLLQPLDRSGGRKALTERARRAIAETLASSRGASPLYPRV
jgi:1-acyl-sn-glycerol-3-phosphate acyltransferase